jgi:outer membrane immunogenic protein
LLYTLLSRLNLPPGVARRVDWGLVMRRFALAFKTLFLSIAALTALAAPLFAQAPFGTVSGSNSASGSSWVAGAQGGYNWQNGSAVYGFETDFSFTNLKSSMSDGLSCSWIPCSSLVPPPSANASSNVDWYGTVRGRLGWATGPVLLYGTGGLAYGKVNLSSNFNITAVDPSFFLNSQTSSVKAGWVLGGGIDYMVRPNVLVNLGYQYIDLGTVSVASSAAPIGCSPCSITHNASAHAQFQVISLGLNWKFTPTDTLPKGLASKPWEGGYFGGHVGGAWGNSTSASYSSSILLAGSDVRLKRDITLVGHLDDGLGLYQYRYLGSDMVYVGVMAQEVALIHPDAVVRGALDNYLRVDYGRLGLKLMTLPEWEAQNKGARL